MVGDVPRVFSSSWNEALSALKDGGSEEKPDEDKHDMCDKKQHVLYLQIVLMKQPGPAPQY